MKKQSAVAHEAISLKQVQKAMRLERVRLLEANCSVGNPFGAAPKRWKIENNVGLIGFNDGSRVAATVEVHVDSPDIPVKEYDGGPHVTVRFEVAWSFGDLSLKEISDDIGQALVETGIMIAWPHIREAVANLFFRMGLQAGMIPLMTPQMIPKKKVAAPSKK